MLENTTAPPINCPTFVTKEVDGKTDVVDLMRYNKYATKAGYERYGGKVALSIPDDDVNARATIVSIAPGDGTGWMRPGEPGY